MKAIVTAIFGVYVPVTSPQTVVVNGVAEVVNTVVSGLAGVDWAWIAGVFLFAIVLFCFFRLVGVLLK